MQIYGIYANRSGYSNIILNVSSSFVKGKRTRPYIEEGIQRREN